MLEGYTSVTIENYLLNHSRLDGHLEQTRYGMLYNTVSMADHRQAK